MTQRERLSSALGSVRSNAHWAAALAWTRLASGEARGGAACGGGSRVRVRVSKLPVAVPYASPPARGSTRFTDVSSPGV